MPIESANSARKALESGTYLANHMHEAPIICVFCFNFEHITVTDAQLDRTSVVGGGSIYPAVQNLLLAARKEGLGCVLTTLLWPRGGQNQSSIKHSSGLAYRSVCTVGIPRFGRTWADIAQTCRENGFSK